MTSLIRRLTTRAIGGGIAFLLLASSVAVPVFAADMTVRFAWYMPPGTATDMQANEVTQNIKKYSHGRIDVKTYPGGSLLTEKNLGDGLRNQTVQMGILGMHWWSSLEPSLQWDNIPFLVTDPEVDLKALHGQVGKDVNAILAPHNIIVIGWGFYGFGTSLINKRHPIRTPEDMKGLTLRGDGPLTSAFIKKFGGNAVAMDSSEIYVALQRGALEGAASGLPSFLSRKWVEVAKHVTALRDIIFVYPIQANLSWWKGLTSEQRKTISRAVAATEQDNVKTIKAAWNKNLTKLEQLGVHVVKPEGKALVAWRKGTSFIKGLYLDKAGAKGKRILTDMKKYVQQ